MKYLLCPLLFICALPFLASLPAQAIVNVIVDTDIGPDCGDVNAIVVLHGLADRGEVNILATICDASNPWGAPCLDALNGMRLGMISNGNADQQRRKLKATEIDQRFEIVVISSEVGIAKPDAGIFHEACRQMNVNPSDCIMVGDNWDRDVLGARLAGLRAIWLCRDREMLGNQAGIASLYELSVNLAV